VNFAYVDTSWLVAIAFDEPGARRLADRLRRFDRRFASNLLEAELRSALAREGVADRPEPLLSWITWVYPNRPLTPELDQALAFGYLRGADLWHLATALFLAPEPEEIAFLTLDQRQREVAARLGFATGSQIRP
jgi:predicted nucleic acid-binding protein